MEVFCSIASREEGVAVTAGDLGYPRRQGDGKGGMLYWEELLITHHGHRTQDKLIGQLNFLPVKSH